MQNISECAALYQWFSNIWLFSLQHNARVKFDGRKHIRRLLKVKTKLHDTPTQVNSINLVHTNRVNPAFKTIHSMSTVMQNKD